MDKSDYEILAHTSFEALNNDSNAIKEADVDIDIAIHGVGYIETYIDPTGKIIRNRIDPLEIINEPNAQQSSMRQQ